MANRLRPDRPIGKKPKAPSSKKKVNRAKQVRRDKDKVRNISVTLMDIDKTIMYYFDKVIQPKVTENDEVINVPLRYASPERWSAIQRDGVFRDVKGQVLFPIIVFKRNSLQKDEQMQVKSFDGNQLRYMFEKKYTDVNRYDRFTLQNGLIPKKEFYSLAMPNFHKINYTCQIYTEYVEQMNKIVESVSYNEGRYWGEPNKFRFRTQIDSFEDQLEISTDSDRLVKTEFTLTINGYLIPESLDYEVLTQKEVSPARIVLKEGEPIDSEKIFRKK
tara:strand:- start:64 stop:885 length:822 start_codon:yes stop_codon:yes gene_type:complete